MPLWLWRSLVDFMSKGTVIVTYRVMPKGVETDLNRLQEEINKKFQPQKMEVVPIGFGLNFIKMIKVLDEEEGLADRGADEIATIEGVQSVEIIGMSRGLWF